MSAAYAQVERLARQIAENAGRNYDARYAKRAHWRGKARRFLAIKSDPPELIMTLMRAMGWQV